MDAVEVNISLENELDAGLGEARLLRGPKGEPGAVFTPSVTDGVLSWTNDGGLENPAPADISGPKGDRGDKGDKGDAGEPGSGLRVLGQYGSLAELEAAVPAPEPGDNYYVGAEPPYSVYTWGAAGGEAQWIDGGLLQGAAGGYYVPAVDAAGNLSWTASESGMPPVQGANIRGAAGEAGAPGADAKINGVNTLTLEAGEHIGLEQSGSALTIKAVPALFVHISGAAGAETADRGASEIYAALQSGLPVFALWKGLVLPLTSAAADEAVFSLVTPWGYASVTAGTSGVSCAEGGLSASDVAFDGTTSGLEATDVQAAMDELMWLLGMY